jgi:DNA-binding CsgD family transcriptional regulator
MKTESSFVNANRADSAAIQTLRAAATAVAPLMPAVAVALIERAFSLLSLDDPTWLVTGCQAIDIFADAKRGHDAIVIADRLLETPLESEIAARIQTQVARLLWDMGHIEKMRMRVESAQALEGVSDQTHAKLLALRALALSTTADRSVALIAGESALEESRRVFARDAECDSLRALGESSRNDGRLDIALNYFKKIHDVDEMGPSLDEVMSLQLLDRYDLSGGILTDARANDNHQLDPLRAAKIELAQMWHDYGLGLLDEAEADALALQDLCGDLQEPSFHYEAYLILCRIAQLRGRLSAGREHLEAAVSHADEDNESQVYLLLFISAWQSQYEGDVDAALAIVRRVVLPTLGIKHRWRWQAAWLVSATQMAIAAHDLELAECVVSQARVLAVQNPEVRTIVGIAAHADGLVSGDIDILRRAVTLLLESPRPLIRANALADLGSAELRNGNRERGVAALDDAWEIYNRLGADGEARTVQLLLHAVGVRRRRWAAAPARPLNGWGALTRAEQSVARLIADGHTNRGAASELRLSPNTIAAHLRSIFGKLDVSSRVQLTLAVIGHT